MDANHNRQRLLELLNRKTRAAYKELFGRFYGALVCYCTTFVHRREVAEDIVQEAFGRLWESTVRFNTFDALIAWLYTSVRNASLDHLKHLKVEQRYNDSLNDEPLGDGGLEYDILREETFRLIFNAIDRLPPQHRRILHLYMQEHDGPRIAAMLGLSIETVRTHRKNALRTLRKELGHLFTVAVALGLV
jgi:RNA polymerase sigma-70 factor (ECF subfamily)